jgi:uncharacterized membrane protein
MTKGRLEAFSDGVIAIIITIMVLELKIPHGDTLEALKPMMPAFISYVLSFVYIAIYWNNHHHMLHIVRHINGSVLWANTHLLFWLSLIPFATNWMGENHFTTWPVAVYGFILLMCAIAYSILDRALEKAEGKDSLLRIAVGSDLKGKISLMLYGTAIAFAFVETAVSLTIFAIVAGMWFLPDTRLERHLKEGGVKND